MFIILLDPLTLALLLIVVIKNAHNDFLVGIILVSLGFLGLLYCWAYKRYCVDHDDPSVLIRSIPVVDFNPQNFEDGLECVICLSELADGDKAKLLPSCKHWFHAHCIDAWLESQATCPICRTSVCVGTGFHPPTKA
ncbi:hypothetical protein Bca52824_017141 [Brassica carinata]|uniref:RING-type E3 ubiquitin transferase n=1 Tax=Brassica carinata TaxID=52824 RepID=A0A8X8AV27_BRACI|nr:hypothetical protein Bca52824_017141 [Brassica carinata]